MSRHNNRYGLVPRTLWDNAVDFPRELFNLFDVFGAGDAANEYRTASFPKMTIDDEKDAFVVKAALPGYEPDKMEAEVIGDFLTIRGEKYTGGLDDGERYIHRERMSDHLEETIKLPGKVVPGKVSARYKDGILTVTLPREEEKTPQAIKVKVE